jgi:DNA-binding beta-propeller fold protein YncE
VIYAPSDNAYGVKLSSDGKHLYVFDGNKKGIALDSITLNVVKDENGNGSGGSGGCETRVAGFAVLVALGLVIPGKKVKK